MDKLKLQLFFRFATIVFTLVILTFYTLSAAGEAGRPTRLTVNFLLHPNLVIQDGYPVNIDLQEAQARNEIFQYVEIAHKQPLLGWQLNSNQNNTTQVAYRLIVSSSMENANENNGDFWDSGKVFSSQSINIKYSGKELQPRAVYYWKVKTWDNHGDESVYSFVQQFKCADTLLDYPETSTYPLKKQDFIPVKIKKLKEGYTLVDFGKTRFGQLRVNLFGSSDKDTIMLHLGEKIKEGQIDRKPEGSVRYESMPLVLNKGWHTYHVLIPPHYYQHKPDRIIKMPDYIGKVMPFRYFEVENYPYELLRKEHVQQVAVNYLFEENASNFHCSDTILNAIWEICKHTIQTTSFCGIYVDGDRERFPREADSYINQMSHYGVEHGFSLARSTHEYQITYASQWTEWLMHVVLMAWADFMETGDASSMEHFYDDLKCKSLIALARDDGLISTRTGLVTWDVIKSVHWQKTEWQRQKKEMPCFRDIVDWPQSGMFGQSEKRGETDQFVFKDINAVVNAFHYRSLVLLEQIANHLNKTEDALWFHQQAKKVKKSFNKVLLNKKKGIYVDGEGTEHSSLHANMFALAHGLVSKKNQEKVIEFIKSRGLLCSPYGAYYMLEALYNGEEANYAIDLITNQTNRSWARWIYEFGSTNTLESWGPEFKSNLDWSHPWGSAPASIIPRKIMGIEPLEPGYSKIRIKPQPGCLAHAEMILPTIRGNVKVSFNNKDQDYAMNINIPANMKADIYVPKMKGSNSLRMNGEKITVQVENSFWLIKDVGSGAYLFTN